MRTNLQTTADLSITYRSTAIDDCKLSVDGGNLVLTAGGQTTSVPLTPVVGQYQTPSPLTIGLQSSVSVSVAPRSGYGNTSYISFAGPLNAAYQTDLILVEIANGVVFNVTANDAATQTQTICGTRSGGNLNTDRSLDVLNLPAALLASLKTAAVATLYGKAEVIKAVTAADLTGVAVDVNFGRGVYTTTNADASIKDVTRINDCKVEIKDGKLHMASVQAGYDKTVVLNQAVYTYPTLGPKTNKDQLLLRGYLTPGVNADITLTIDVVAGTPIVTGASGFLLGGNSTFLSCPRG